MKRTAPGQNNPPLLTYCPAIREAALFAVCRRSSATPSRTLVMSRHHAAAETTAALRAAVASALTAWWPPRRFTRVPRTMPRSTFPPPAKCDLALATRAPAATCALPMDPWRESSRAYAYSYRPASMSWRSMTRNLWRASRSSSCRNEQPCEQRSPWAG